MSVTFNGNYVYRTTTPGLDYNRPYCIAGWLRSTSNSGFRTFFAMGIAGDGSYGDVAQPYNTTWSLYIDRAGSWIDGVDQGNGLTCPLNTWVYVVVVRVHSRRLELWQNGRLLLVNTTEATGSPNSNLYIGRNVPDVATEAWQGQISAVKVWKVAKDARKIYASERFWYNAQDIVGLWAQYHLRRATADKFGWYSTAHFPINLLSSGPPTTSALNPPALGDGFYRIVPSDVRYASVDRVKAVRTHGALR